MSTVAPSRSPRQRLDALKRADQVRLARAHLKKRLRETDSTEHSCRLVAGLLDDVPPEAEGMRVDALLKAIRGFGDVKTYALLAQLRVSPRRSLSSLTERQRGELAERLAS